MKISQQRQLDRFGRVESFFQKHEGDFAPSSRAHTLWTGLSGVIQKVNAEASAPKVRGGAPRGERSQKQQLLNTLRADLVAIADTAQLIAKHNKSIEGKFELPDKRRKDKLASTARHFLTEAEPVKKEFFAYELPEDFLKTLKDNLDAYEASENKPVIARAKSSDNKAAVDGSLAEGAELVNDLRVVVSNKYRTNADVLGEWEAAFKLETSVRKPRQKKNKA